MKADRKKLEIAMANSCMNAEDLQKESGLPRPSLNNVIIGRLGCDIATGKMVIL